MVPLFRSILAAIDMSDADLPPLRYARLFAEKYGASLTVMYSDPIAFPADAVGPVSGFCAPVSREQQVRLRVEIERHVGHPLSGCRYEIDAAVGRPTPAILRAAQDLDADLVVTGTHRRRGWIRALLGSVSEGVLHGARCPVMVAPELKGEQTSAAISKILCPINFTEVARTSLQVASQVASKFGASLVIAHVVEPDLEADLPAAESQVQTWIEQELDGAGASRQVILRGGAAERVLDFAEEMGADLLVIGAQHTMFRETTVIGTTTERLLRFASSPILVVPRQAVGERRSESQRTVVTA